MRETWIKKDSNQEELCDIQDMILQTMKKTAPLIDFQVAKPSYRKLGIIYIKGSYVDRSGKELYTVWPIPNMISKEMTEELARQTAQGFERDRKRKVALL